MGVIIIVFGGDCHTQGSPGVMKCLFKGAPRFLSQRKGCTAMDTHWLPCGKGTFTHSLTLPDTAQLLWLWTGRAILILPPLGAVDAHSSPQPFSWISNTHFWGLGAVFFF